MALCKNIGHTLKIKMPRGYRGIAHFTLSHGEIAYDLLNTLNAFVFPLLITCTTRYVLRVVTGKLIWY